jgi:hypothetical protein
VPVLKKNIAAITLIIALALSYNLGYLNDLPAYIHAWAQADRYALALGFTENGLNFFKPQTFIYNHQFPYWWMRAENHTVTAVDFPLHDYIPAVIMEITGVYEPFIFKGYILLTSIVGLFFLFKLAHLITGRFATALFTIVFASTSPVFVYYQANFLPTIPSLAAAMVGVYFYYRYSTEKHIRFFWWSILALTIAALSRTTFAIPLIAISGVEFLRILRKEGSWHQRFWPLAFSVIVILSYLAYNSYLRHHYGSHFLSSLMPPENLNDAKELVAESWNNWGLQYLSSWHYAIFVSFSALTAYFVLRRNVAADTFKNWFGLFTATYLFGCFCFAVIMLRQFPAHDYYFLDTFFLPLLLVMIKIVAVVLTHANRFEARIIHLFALLITVALVLVPFDSQQNRRAPGVENKTAITIKNFEGSAHFLDSLGISREARILVIDAVAPNLPFIHLKREGYAVMMPTYDNIKEAMSWDYDYVVVQNEFFVPVVYQNYPEFLQQVVLRGSNGKIMVCEAVESQHNKLYDFLGYSEEQLALHVRQTFEDGEVDEWENVVSLDSVVFSGAYSGVMTPEMEYGITRKLKNPEPLRANPVALFVSGYFLAQDQTKAELVVALSAGGETVFYQSRPLAQQLTNQNQWEPISFVFMLPAVHHDEYELAVYLWNRDRSTLRYDDIDIRVYR